MISEETVKHIFFGSVMFPHMRVEKNLECSFHNRGLDATKILQMSDVRTYNNLHSRFNLSRSLNSEV